jgi:hypothetical protein
MIIKCRVPNAECGIERGAAVAFCDVGNRSVFWSAAGMRVWKPAIGSLAPARSALRAFRSLCSRNPFRRFPSGSSQPAWKPALRSNHPPFSGIFRLIRLFPPFVGRGGLGMLGSALRIQRRAKSGCGGGRWTAFARLCPGLPAFARLFVGARGAIGPKRTQSRQKRQRTAALQDAAATGQPGLLVCRGEIFR